MRVIRLKSSVATARRWGRALHGKPGITIIDRRKTVIGELHKRAKLSLKVETLCAEPDDNGKVALTNAVSIPASTCDYFGGL